MVFGYISRNSTSLTSFFSMVFSYMSRNHTSLTSFFNSFRYTWISWASARPCHYTVGLLLKYELLPAGPQLGLVIVQSGSCSNMNFYQLGISSASSLYSWAPAQIWTSISWASARPCHCTVGLLLKYELISAGPQLGLVIVQLGTCSTFLIW